MLRVLVGVLDRDGTEDPDLVASAIRDEQSRESLDFS